MKKKQILFGITALSVLLGIWNSHSIKLKATEGLENPETFANAPAEWVGDVNQAGKLKYGYVKARGGSSPAIENTLVANVQFDKGGGEMISHIFMSKSQGTIAGSGFNLYETSEEYQTVTSGGPSGKPVGIVDFEVPTLTGTSIKVNGSRQGSTEYQVEAELMPIEKNAQILHNFTITNTSSGAKTFYPIHYVDTELAHNDNVQVKSRGEGQGLYIETVEYEGKEPIEGSPTYRLNYITNVPNGPISYKGIQHGTAPEKALGTDMDKPDTSHVNVPQGEIVPGPTISDSGIMLAWGKQVLAAGESVTFSYAVGIETGSMEVIKEVENQTSQDGEYRVNDTLEYKISLINDDLKVSYADLLVEDQLPIGLDAPSKISLVKEDGSEEELDIAEVYDETSHKIKVKPVNVATGSEGSPTVVSLKYTTTITKAGAGTEVINNVSVTGTDSFGVDVEEEAEKLIDVLALGEVIINYQNTDKEALIPQKKIEGSVGDTYNEEPVAISGYSYQSVEGSPQGQFTDAVQEITFIYEQKVMYNLRQSVTNSNGMNLDKGEASVNEELTYSVTLTPELTNLTEEEKAANYRDVLITEIVDPNLDEAKDVTLTTEKGVAVGEVTYDSTTKEIRAIITESDDVKMTEKLILTYKAKVKAGTTIGTVLKEKAEAVVSYTFSKDNTFSQISNEVETIVSKSSAVFVKYVNEDGTEIHESKSYELGEDGDYNETAITIDGFTFDYAEGETSGIAKPGESVYIVFHYKSAQFELIQKVEHVDGSAAEFVKNEAELIYTIKLNSLLKDDKTFYKDFIISEKIDSSLESIEKIQLVNEAGDLVGKVEMSAGKITGEITEKDKIKGPENLTLTYHATVKNKESAPEGTLIKEQGSAKGTFVNESEIPAREQLSNEVVSTILGGDLIFESAPKELGFGDNLKISLKAKDYPVVTKTADLSVIDTRGKNEAWSMTAKMTKLMVNDQHTLGQAMHYVLDGKEQLMTLDTSAKVYDKVTDSDDIVIISEEWQDTTVGPVLKVGKNEARIGSYQGVIQWTLQDTPLGE